LRTSRLAVRAYPITDEGSGKAASSIPVDAAIRAAASAQSTPDRKALVGGRAVPSRGWLVVNTACSYREYKPHPALADRVWCYWSVHSEQARDVRITSRGLSKGHVDLIFATGGAFCEAAEQSLGETGDLRCYVVGPLPEAALAHSTGGLCAVGIKLRPGRAYPLLRTSCSTLAGCPVTVRSIWPEVSSSYLERVADASQATERLGLLERILLARVDKLRSESAEVRHALDIIGTTRGKTTIDALMEMLDIGARQLERQFREQVGLTPIRMCQIARIQHAIELARAEAKPNWPCIAFECGFYDQAHLIRHFKSVTGLSPNAYLAEATLKLSEM
ncbi:MAG TPA: helix-turn-helix domain-containing protein, partial [Polyangiaceae bacterium]